MFGLVSCAFLIMFPIPKLASATSMLVGVVDLLVFIRLLLVRLLG